LLLCCQHGYNSTFCALQLVDRASCYFCLQEWAAGIKDLCYVLVFVPNHKKALLLRYVVLRYDWLCKLLPSLLHELLVVIQRAYPLSVSCEVCFTKEWRTLWCHCRARAYSCVREWALSRADYHSVLFHHPGCAEATKGLQDIQDTVIVLPMLGDNLLDNGSA
jgi:hypothetical protein